MWYIFEKQMLRGPQKQCSQVSDIQIHTYKYTNTQIQFATLLWLVGSRIRHFETLCKEPWCDTFLKSRWYVDLKNNVLKCLTYTEGDEQWVMHRWCTEPETARFSPDPFTLLSVTNDSAAILLRSQVTLEMLIKMIVLIQDFHLNQIYKYTNTQIQL